MNYSELFNRIFDEATALYHVADHVDAETKNPYAEGSIEFLLFSKNMIDAVQWHLEDIIRNPVINPTDALIIKRRIDRSNQERTDLVEYIDDYFVRRFENVIPNCDARINTETPAWAIDRLSILALKIYHMRQETMRNDATPKHAETCRQKLNVLLDQKSDLSTAIDDLLANIESGSKKMKLYRQMKMYNDPALNPVLYGAKK
ncbi:MAG: DUF4254 domain-containing protein [Cytophagaceae bacterium]|jgi:hypothetical protein|nr:DUF4254 domain-containing protein [Cytophagaceae bacterium]